MGNVQRTSKEAIDLGTVKVITSDNLMALCDDKMDKYAKARHETTSRHH